MDDRFEATFVVEVSPPAVWQAMTQSADAPEERRSDSSSFLWFPGFESRMEVIESEAERCLRVRKDEQPCKGTEVWVVLEAVERGTCVTVVQSGFGEAFARALNSMAIGWDLIVKDLALYLERGVRGNRHRSAWGIGLGCAVDQVPSGLIVTRLARGGCAERTGLTPGDHILAVAGVPVLTERDLAMVMRTCREGTTLEVDWLRGRERLSGSCAIAAPEAATA
jgi:hypothetical protein